MLIPPFLKTLFAVFLILHGLVHAGMAFVPVTAETQHNVAFWPSLWRSATNPAWLASKMGLSQQTLRLFGTVIWMAATLGFAAAGMGLLGIPGLQLIWRELAIGASVISLSMFLFFWHGWFIVGISLSALTLLAALFRWPFN